jgi:hypothetical protein
MCYVLYMASPLTLSEIRSMLPAGITADALAPDDERRLRRAFRDTRTIARLRIGPCACDLILSRDPAGHREESLLRARYATMRLGRPAIIRALALHRACDPDQLAESADHWRGELAAFVAEHARNAGPSWYWLRFAADPDAPPPDPPAGRTLAVSDVRAAPADWLAENVPVRVVR